MSELMVCFNPLVFSFCFPVVFKKKTKTKWDEFSGAPLSYRFNNMFLQKLMTFHLLLCISF